MSKHEQLGMNASTASHRLIKDLLFNFAARAGHVCFHCGTPLTRDSFSIEHKVPWLHSDDPKGLFFDASNIAYSHISCNVEARRQSIRAICGTVSKYSAGCRCADCKKASALKSRACYSSDKRRSRYLKNEKPGV